MKTLNQSSLTAGLLLVLFAVSASAIAADDVLRGKAKVTFTVALKSFTLMGAPPEAIGVAGNRLPLAAEEQLPPSLVLREVKGSKGLYSGTTEFPEGTQRDLSFTFMCRVDGLWLKEPNSLGIPHLILLDSAKSAQSVFFAYDSVSARVTPQPRLGLAADDYDAARSLALAKKQSAIARQYEYWNTIAMLRGGRTTEAQNAYSRFRAAAPSGLLSHESYDRFPIVHASVLARSGKASEAIKVLRAVPAGDGNAEYQAEIRMDLARLLERNSDVEEARSMYADLQKRSGVSSILKEQAATTLARSYARESSPGLIARAKQLLRSVVARTRDQQNKRQALLALADIERREKNRPAVMDALKEASLLGTIQERLAVLIQRLDEQYAAEDYVGVHTACKWVLDKGQPGRHHPHLLWLDAVSLKRLGMEKESMARFRTLDSAYAGSAYARYAAYTLSSLSPQTTAGDSLTKGATQR